MVAKRKSNVTPDGLETEAGRAPKVSRTPALNSEISSGQRFGESVDFIPLPPLSQSFEADEADEDAADVVEGSQDVDESSLTTSILYGMHRSITLLKSSISQYEKELYLRRLSVFAFIGAMPTLKSEF